VFSQEINEEWQEYACFVSERARLGHLHLLIADASIAHGVNFAISGVVLAKSFVEEQPASTVFQLMGRAGRRGLSDEAKILTCESWRQKLKSCLQEGHDLFEDLPFLQATFQFLPPGPTCQYSSWILATCVKRWRQNPWMDLKPLGQI